MLGGRSIQEFVERRWADAKAELRKLDSEFVHKIESTVRLQDSGLETPWPVDVGDRPVRPLPKEWRRLLGACYEMTVGVSILQVTAHDLTAEANRGLSPVEVGRRFLHHNSAWFVHAMSLTEAADRVIHSTAEVYVVDSEERSDLTKRYKERMRQDISREIRGPRNDYVHPANMPLASSITGDRLWEPLVAAGLTPQRSVREFDWPIFGESVLSGRYAPVVANTTTMLERLGSILRDLDADIALPEA